MLKKIVRRHSRFVKSPFDLGRYMHCVTWKKKKFLFDWIENGVEVWGDLTR